MEACCSTVKINISLQFMHDEGITLSDHLLCPCDGGWCGEESSLCVLYITFPEIDCPFCCIESLPMCEFNVPQSIVAILFLEEEGEIEGCLFLLGVGVCL